MVQDKEIWTNSRHSVVSALHRAGEMKVDGRVDTQARTGERLGKCKRRQMMVQKLLDIFAPPQPPNQPKWNTCQGFN